MEWLQSLHKHRAMFSRTSSACLDPLSPVPEFVDLIVPGNRPIAFTNPIFVDLAGDGFDAPGLPVMAAAAGATTLSAEKRREVLAHVPIHRIRLPAPE